MARHSEAVEPGTVWTWNAIGKAAGAWSEWYRPKAVEPPYGVVPPAPLKSILELRYRVRPYGT